MEMLRQLGDRRCIAMWIGLLVAVAGCHVAVIDRQRNIIDGVPRLGTDTCCPPERHPGANGRLGNCDLRRYGRRPLVGDPLAHQLVPWHEGPDCDGHWLVLERLVGQRRAGHWIPVLSALGIGRPAPRPVFSRPFTFADELAVLENTRFWFSLEKSVTIDGLRIRNEDIVGYDGCHVARLFDGSDVGLGKLEIDGFALLNDHQILLSFSAAFSIDGDHPLPGIAGDIDDSDILLFDAQSFGEITRGTFSLYFDGSDVGLTDDTEDVDAVAIRSDGALVLSTVGDADIGGHRYRDEDLLLFQPRQLGPDTDGQWSRIFDGSDVGLSASSEDIDAVGMDDGNEVYFSVRGELDANDVHGGPADVFRFIADAMADKTIGRMAPELFFNSKSLPLEDNDITGFDLPIAHQ